MTEFVTKVWEAEEGPSKWKKVIVCPVCEKGEKMVCTDFMGVNLYIVAYWTQSIVLYIRYWVYVEIMTEKHQRALL